MNVCRKEGKSYCTKTRGRIKSRIPHFVIVAVAEEEEEEEEEKKKEKGKWTGTTAKFHKEKTKKRRKRGKADTLARAKSPVACITSIVLLYSFHFIIKIPLPETNILSFFVLLISICV